jgi:valyl-tRNA synthetase
MDLRPQAHDIIRTWLFSTVVRAHTEHGVLPWRHVAISGWILDPDRKKMSKSKGNVVTPMALLEQYGSDAVRYWAAGARPGTDTAFDPGQMKIGRRLAIKVLNASRFALSAGATPGEVTAPLDRALLAELADTVEAATAAMDDLDHARALEVTERFFWHFCDDYLELVKARVYGEHGPDAAASARAGLATALSVLLRLFAPVLPFVTEEVWSWWQEGSVHLATWPDAAELRAQAGDPEVLTAATDVLTAVRRAKSAAKLSMRTEVSRAAISAPRDVLDRVRLAERDIRSAGHIRHLETYEADAVSVEVTWNDAASPLR